MNIETVTWPSAEGLEVKISRDSAEITEAQKLRYKVFCEEMGAIPTPEAELQKRDFDEYDEICDHLLVKDTKNNSVVGTYRLLRKEHLKNGIEFYTAKEFDITPILKFKGGEIMELGRSCVAQNYRNRATMQLLWRGIGVYCTHYNIKLMFGCASLPGSDYKQHAVQLSYLYSQHLAPADLRPKALPELYKPMNPTEAFDTKKALSSLPPLLKGYMRLGGFVGDGAVEDKKYNTTDVCLIVRTALITERYYNRYGPEGKE